MQSSCLTPLLSLAISALFAGPAAGQWIAEAHVGADRYWGGAAERGGEQRSLRPYRPSGVSAGLQWRSGGMGAGLRLGYVSAGMALEGPDAVTAVKGVFTTYALWPELLVRIARVGANELLLRGGPVLELWTIRGEKSQSRIGLQAGVSLRVPLEGRFAGAFTCGAAVMPSPFSSSQLEDVFERRTLWRRSVAAGVEYRL